MAQTVEAGAAEAEVAQAEDAEVGAVEDTTHMTDQTDNSIRAIPEQTSTQTCNQHQ